MPKFKVKTSEAGQRADRIIASRYPKFSRSSLKALFVQAKVRLRDATLKAGHKLHAGEAIEVDDQLISSRPKPPALPIIYEDDEVTVINKPAGLLSHSKGALNLESTVADFLATKITDKALSGNRPGIVHRLDRATSGVMIGAKTKPALDYLQKQFASRRVQKTYLAIVEGEPAPAEALIDAPIGRNPARPQSFKVSARGRAAQTRFKSLKTVSKDGKNYSLLELMPLTGRTHQLRVHLKYIGHPVVGDRLYGHGSDQLYLHAAALSLRLPSGKPQTFKVPPPASFKGFMGS